MASNFAFVPQGLSTSVTAVAATNTITLTGTGPSITTGTFLPDGVRIANPGTSIVFIQFGVTAPTVGAATGMQIFGNTVETFQLKGQKALAYYSPTTSTLSITQGEGL